MSVLINLIFFNRSDCDILANMEKNLLIAGKDLPHSAELADAMMLSGYKVVAASGMESGVHTAHNFSDITWNKSSAISSRSLVIQAEMAVGFIDTAILYFDTPLYASQYKEFNADSCPRVLSEVVSGYQYLSLELLSRIKQRKAAGRIIFVLKTHPSLKDALTSGVRSADAAAPSGPLVAAAEAAFTAFAENFAAYTGDVPTASVLLITGSSQNETIRKDDLFATWLTGYLNALDAQKTKPNIKTACTWIKAGARMPGSGFSFFH